MQKIVNLTSILFLLVNMVVCRVTPPPKFDNTDIFFLVYQMPYSNNFF